MFNTILMSIESLNRTSEIDKSKIHLNSIKENKTPKKVNIDVLKRRVAEQDKKERFQSKIIVGVFFVSLGLIGYLVG